MTSSVNHTGPFSTEGSFEALAKSIPSPDRLQHTIIFYSSLTVLAVMGVTIFTLLLTGLYKFDGGLIADGLTVLALLGAAALAFRHRNLVLEGVLLCISIPFNLVAMLLFDTHATFTALQLLSITPIIWGLFTTLRLSAGYTAFVAAFILWFMGPAGRLEIVSNGNDETMLTAITLCLVTISCGIASTLPKQLGRKVYDALKNTVERENIHRSRSTAFAEMSSDWHFEVDAHGKIIYFFGKGEALGRHWRDVLIGWQANEKALNKVIEERRVFARVKGWLKTAGVDCPVEFSGRPLFSAKGEFRGYHGIAHDISIREEYERKLKQQATTDLLTGLENRHAFNTLVETCKLGSGPDQLSILYIDLDKFKELNDRHGHAGGDAVLVELGSRLSDMSRSIAQLRVFRIGGDEFCCVLASPVSLEEISELAQRIRSVVSIPIKYDGRLIDMTASIGAAIGVAGQPVADVLEQADAAVYEAKSLGGDTCIVPDAHIRGRLERRVTIHRDLKSAIADGDIALHYQPIRRVSDCQIVGVEALARWTHPKYGIITPSEFIEIAEASRHIIAFGQYVLRSACVEVLGWMKQSGEQVRLSVNVSPNELLSHGFFESVSGILAETGFPAHLLELEITERGVLRNIEMSCEVIEAVRNLGVTIALDDFGTGNSSLSRLENLPVDRVKIDRSFFVRAEQSDRARQILGILSGMSRVLDINVIAEGVETEEQFRFVNLAGFGEVQGYLFGRPVPIEELRSGYGQSERESIPA